MDDRCWLLDLDGVLWLASEPIAGGAEAVALLAKADRRVVFFTNNSARRLQDQVDKLASFGIEVAPDDVVTSSQAVARLCEPGSRALVLGGEGIVEALEERGVEAIDASQAARQSSLVFDDVVVGIDLQLSYSRLSAAVSVVLAGARLLGTNDDATFPSPSGPLPGAGAILAAVAVATSKTPLVAGKPEQPAADLTLERIGAVATVVGDRPETDGLFARRLGARFALVHSGVTPADHGALDPSPDCEAADLLTLVRRELGEEGAASRARGTLGP